VQDRGPRVRDPEAKLQPAGEARRSAAGATRAGVASPHVPMLCLFHFHHRLSA
jgi:hypothetical protein